MKLLLTGATGFIGSRLRTALVAAGHDVVCAGRRAPAGVGADGWVPADFAEAPSATVWREHLRGVEVVVNTVGIFRESGALSFDAIHRRGPCALFDACVVAGVRRVVQLSALGADEGAETAYHRSKKAADDHLLALPVEAVVVQPSLVYGAGGTSARFFLALATLPLLALPAGGRQPLQPVHVDDLVEALRRLVEQPLAELPKRIAIVGPEPVTLAAYLQGLRRSLRLPRAAVVAVPAGLVAIAARIGDRLPGSLFDSASWRMLRRGSVAPVEATAALLGRPPRRVADFVPADHAAGERSAAELAWLVPVLRVSLAIVWLVTGVVSFGLYPVEESYALLGRTGVPPDLQPLMLYGAAALDLLLGASTLAPLAARGRRRLWIAQATLIAGYTAIITLQLPEFWLHPYGPILKNVPILAILLQLYALDRAED